MRWTHFARGELTVWLLLFVALPCHASGRYALFIAAHQGRLGEPTLRYSGADAERLRDVLVENGEFLPEDVVLLKDPSADRVRQALARLNAHLREEPTGDMLLVYYSGHADGVSLHLNGTSLPWDELRNLTTGSPARLRLLIVDACRSGQATRVKGTRMAGLLPTAVPEILAEGVAILTAAASSESAQESDFFEGSFFTYHLVAGLRGLADANGDGAVTLSEAYQYASQRTVASTASTWAGIQHPTYAYDLKGRADVVITRPLLGNGGARLQLTRSGEYLLRLGGAEGQLVVQALVQTPRTVRVPSGRYFLQRRSGERLEEGALELRRNEVLDVGQVRLRPVPLDNLVRKGGAPHAFALAVWTTEAGSALAGYSNANGAAVSFSTDLQDLTLDSELDYAHSHASSNQVRGYADVITLGVGARKVIDVGMASAGAGLRLGASAFHQSYESLRDAPPRTRVVPHVDALLRLDVRLGHGFFAAVEGGLRTLLVKVRVENGGDSNRTPWIPMGSLGAGYRW